MENVNDNQIIKVGPITTTEQEKLAIKSIVERIVELIKEKHF
jgi:hypothetical protein